MKAGIAQARRVVATAGGRVRGTEVGDGVLAWRGIPTQRLPWAS